MDLKKILFASILAGTTFCANATDLNTKSGYFYVFNDTNHTVNIEVGNFFPTPYTISPNSFEWILVSTNNQNIHIKKVS